MGQGSEVRGDQARLIRPRHGRRSYQQGTTIHHQDLAGAITLAHQIEVGLNEGVQVLQLHPTSDALAQLHIGPQPASPCSVSIRTAVHKHRSCADGGENTRG